MKYIDTYKIFEGWNGILKNVERQYSLAKKAGYSDEFIGFLKWYGNSGYMSVGKFSKKLPITGVLTNECKEALLFMLDMFLLKGGYQKWSGDNMPHKTINTYNRILADHIDLLWVYENFTKFCTTFDKPTEINRICPTDWTDKNFIIEDRWSSWSLNRNNSNTFDALGNKQIIIVPKGFLYVDTMELCDEGEIIVNSSEIIKWHDKIKFI